MAKRNHYSNKRQQNKAAARPPMVKPELAGSTAVAPKPKTVYGPPVIILEDQNKNTFLYARGAWVPHDKNIAECRLDCQVKELSQKVNKMTRYEVRSPI